MSYSGTTSYTVLISELLKGRYSRHQKYSHLDIFDSQRAQIWLLIDQNTNYRRLTFKMLKILFWGGWGAQCPPPHQPLIYKSQFVFFI